MRRHYLFPEVNSFRLRNTLSFEEQIMPKDKCPSIFSRQMETIKFIILQIVFETWAVLKIGEC